MSELVDLDIAGKEANIVPNYHRTLDVSVEGVDPADIVESTGIHALLDAMETEDILEYVGMEKAKEYWGLIEPI